MRIPTLAVTMAAAAAIVALPTAANAVPPVTVADSAQTERETATTVNVLANDSLDAGNSGKSLTVTSLTPTAGHGTVSCTNAGACTYTPADNWVGSDTFNYTVSDGTESNTGTVTVNTVVVSLITVSSTPANLVATTTDRNPVHKVTGTVTTTGGLPLAGAQVQLYSRTDLSVPATPVEDGLATSNDNGKIVVEGLAPVQKTWYSWKSVGGKRSSERSVTVTPFLNVSFGNKKFAEGEDLTVTGLSGPVTTGQNVVLERKEAAGWTEVESVQFGAPGVDNSAPFAFAPISHPNSGSFLYRVIVPQDDALGREKATSGQTTIQVYDAQITRVETVNSDEFVTVKNTGLVSFNLLGWKLSDADSNVTLPSRSVAAGGIVRIHTGKGTNTSKDLYLKRTGTLWPTTGSVTLTDNDTVEMDEFVFGP